MTGTRKNGIDAATALLLALIRHGGSGRAMELARETGIPRASFHRIVRTLAAIGVLERHRGLVQVGPVGLALVQANAKMVRVEDQRRAQRTKPWSHWGATTELTSASDVGPILLSRPLTRKRTRQFRIGFSNATMDNPWRVALVHSVERAAANLADRIEHLVVRHASNDIDRQLSDIEDLVASGIDGLLVSAAAPDSIGDAVGNAVGRGIATVVVDRPVRHDVPYTSFVKTDDARIGHVTALWLVETLNGRGSILLLPGLQEGGPPCRRLAAAERVFAQFREISVLGVHWTGWDRDRARQIVSQILGDTGNKVDGVWCHSGLQGAGSLQAFIDAGLPPGRIPPHTGGDLNLVYKLALRNRTRLAAIDYPPAMGLAAVETLLSALRGHWVPKFVNVASDVILTRGAASDSVRATVWAEDHVRWDLPDNLILATGLGPHYDPYAFRVNYPGNIYNRSAAEAGLEAKT